MTPTGTYQVAETLEPLLVPIDSLREHPENPRRGNVDAIARSLSAYGQVRPVLAMTDGTIVAGNHTWKAAKKLGWTHIAVVLEAMSPERARAFMLLDNRLNDTSTYDPEALAQSLLLAQADLGDELELLTGYDPSALDDILTLAGMGGPSSPLGDDDRGDALAGLDKAISEPTHEAEFGATYRLGDHRLVVCDLFADGLVWKEALDEAVDENGPDGVVFLPYPTPLVLEADRMRNRTCVLVTPLPLVAGWIMDAWAARGGEIEAVAA